MNTILDAALRYHAAGMSIIPCAPDGSKRPTLPEWTSYQMQCADIEQVRRWFGRGNRWIGVIQGAVSGQREGIDIDNRPAPGYPTAEDLINDLANMVDQELSDLWDRLVIEVSPSAGFHVLYRCNEIAGNQKLATRPATDDERATAKNPHLEQVTIIETRGEGGYFISAPSPGYEILQGDLASVPLITPSEREILFRAARALAITPKTKTVGTVESSTDQGVKPGTDYNDQTSAEDVVQLLEHAGWHACTRRRDGTYLMRRPGKGRGWSATVGYNHGNRLTVFTSNGHPFEPDTTYTPFAVRAFLDHGGDFHQTAHALAVEGYGASYDVDSGPLILETPSRAPTVETPHRQEVPPLPREATAIYSQLVPCGAWLDAYVAYATQVAPTMVPEFHTLAGLFAASTAIARRVCLRYRAGTLFPNLYALFVAPSGYGKTTAFGALKNAVHAAGMNHLFLTDQMTPENLLTQMSTNLPASLGHWEPAVQDQWLHERAFAAQRGWMLDESAFLFDSLSREYMTGLLGLLLKFYDCPDTASRETQSGGRVLVQNVSLSFFGASTSSNMRPHFQNEKWWSDGLWGRFAIVVPSRDAIWVNDEEHAAIPVPLMVVQGLRRIFTMFGMPEARLIEDEKKRSVEIIGTREPVDIQVAPGVYQAWQVYRKAMAFDIGTSPYLDEPLRGSYSRFATHAIKIAMILAVMDTDTPNVTMTRAHYARAQQIAETWRVCMHQVWNYEMRIDERHLSDRALNKLRAAGAGGLTARQLQQQLNRTSREINDVLMLLQSSGLVAAGKEGRKVMWVAV